MRLAPLAGAALAATLAAAPALAMDNEAGVPLSPAEAAGAWTIETQGHAVCTIHLSARHGVTGSSACGDTIPAGAVGWNTTHDGMALVGADGQTLLAFNRWSNSLFVSHRSSGVDIQLKRGGPGALPGTD